MLLPLGRRCSCDRTLLDLPPRGPGLSWCAPRRRFCRRVPPDLGQVALEEGVSMSLGYHQRQARGECGHCGRTLDQPPYRLCSHCYTPSQKRHTVQQAVQRSVPEAEPVIIPTATLECVAQNCPRRITILRSPAMRETAFDGLINPCVRSRCSRSVAVGLFTGGTARPTRRVPLTRPLSNIRAENRVKP